MTTSTAAAPIASDLVTEANRAFYAATAAEYDQMGRGTAVTMAADNVRALVERIPAIQTGTFEVMDFAAGTGLLAMLLAPRVKAITAVDLSPDMISVLQSKLDAQPAEQRIDNITPLAVDLLASPVPPPELLYARFDLVVCTNSFHHFSDPARVAASLASYLKPGGWLAVADLLKTETSALIHAASEPRGSRNHPRHGHDHRDHRHEPDDSEGERLEELRQRHDHVVAHRGGFTRDQMQGFFESAGLELHSMAKSTEMQKNEQAHDVFLAVAQKPERDQILAMRPRGALK